MKRISTFFTSAILALTLCLGFTAAHAQNGYKTKQVIIASSGQFGNPNNYVRIGSYNPDTKAYTVFDSVHSTSTRSILIDGKFAYLTADTLLLKYDIDNYKRVAKESTSGLNMPGGYLAAYKTYILSTRGFGASNNYLVAYNKSDLKQAFAIGGISDQASGILVVGDTAYVGVSGAYNKDTGYLAVIDLVNMQLKREIMLGTMGAQIGKIFTDGTNIYTVNNKRSSISTYNIATGTVSHKVFHAAGSSANGIALSNGRIYTDFGYAGIGAYDITSGDFTESAIVDYMDIEGVSNFKRSVAGAAYDSINKHFYVTSTNYSDTGAAYIFDIQGNKIDSFATGVSPEAIAVDYRSTVGINQLTRNLISVNAYPNPAKNTLNIAVNGQSNAQIMITDISGKTRIQQNVKHANNSIQLDINTLPQGMYILNVSTESGNGFTKFIKQ
ncbi:MAG: T9SS type A sorting domain-containing protein [Bacteroidia bacterium]